eukprot:1930807-Heterocapsa_arctica.AAC.1
MGFRYDPGGLSRLADACGSPERQMRERYPYSAGRARPCGFPYKSGEKEREQNAKRSRTMIYCHENGNCDEYICRSFGSNLGEFEGPNTKQIYGGGRAGGSPATELEKT